MSKYGKQYENGGFASAGAKFVGLDGGLDTKSNDYTSQPPTLLTQNNVWNITSGEVRSLPSLFQGTYTSGAGFTFNPPYYGIYAREPSDPYTTGDVFVHQEAVNTQAATAGAWSEPRMIRGVDAGGTSISGVDNPVIPGRITTKPWGFNGTVTNSLVENPVQVLLSTGIGYQLIFDPATSSTVATTLQTFNTTSGSFLTPITIARGQGGTGIYTTPAYDIIEDVQNPGTALIVNWFRDSTTSVSGFLLQTPAGSTFFSSATVAANILGGDSRYWTVVKNNTTCYIVYFNTTGKTVFLPISAAGFGTAVTDSGGPTSQGYIAAVQNPTVPNIVAVTGIATSGAGINLITYNGTTRVAAQAPVTGTSGILFGSNSASAIAISANDQYGTIWFSLVQTYVSGQANNGIASINFQLSGGTISSTNYIATNAIYNMAGITLTSKGFAYGRNGVYVVARTGARDVGSPANSYAQPTYFVLDKLNNIVGRAFEGQAPNDPALVNTASVSPPASPARTTALSNVSVYPQSQDLFLQIAVPVWKSIVEGFNQGPTQNASLNGGGYLTLGSVGPPNVIAAQIELLHFAIPAQLGGPKSLQTGRSTALPGWLTYLNDGQASVEAGWHETPHWLSAGTTTTGTTNPLGTYLYRAIWRWVDNAGQVHRSAPSPTLSVVQAAAWNSQVINLPQLIRTFRNTTVTNTGGVYLELYRTDANGTTFYLVGSVLGAATAYSITDSAPTQASAAFGVAYPAYWQNTYESSPPPSFVWQVMSQGRHFGLAQVDGGYRVYYTNVWLPGITVEWNTTGYVTCPPELGDCRSLAVLDDKILVIGTISVGVFNGLGPAGAPGTNGIDLNVNDGNFSPVVPIPTAGGAVGTGCPVTLPEGVMYQASQGFMMLDRSLTVTYAGAVVEAYTGVYESPQVIYGQACTLPKLQAVVFTNPTGDSLVYDYVQKKWGVWQQSVTGPISTAVQQRNGLVWIGQQPISGATLPDTYTLNGVSLGAGASNLWAHNTPTGPISANNFTARTFQVETPWLTVGEVPGGEGAVFEAAVLGTYFTPHILQIETAINYQGYGILPGDTITFPVNTAPYPSYQFRVRPPSSDRIWAVKYRVTVLPAAAGNTFFELARLTGIMLFSGTLQGNTRLGNGVSR